MERPAHTQTFIQIVLIFLLSGGGIEPLNFSITVQYQPLLCSVYLQPLEDSLKQAKEVTLHEVKQAFYRLYTMHTYRNKQEYRFMFFVK